MTTAATLIRSNVRDAEQLDSFAAMLAVLDRRGWVQHQFCNNEGVCLVGALEDVFGVQLREDADFALLPLLLNDHRRRLLAQVIRLLWLGMLSYQRGEVDDEDRRIEDMLIGLAIYNDLPDTDRADVELVIKFAAGEVDAQHDHERGN